MFGFTGKTALVTGASGGIGAAIARALHGQGASVVLSGTREAPLAELAAELGPRAHLVLADLAEPEAADMLVAAAEAASGPLDILVNNAGLTRDMLAIRLKDEDWRTVMNVDLDAPFRLARAALRGMVRRRAGRIVNVSSVVAIIGNPGQANYAAAKAGLIGMSKSLAHEVAGRNVTVNTVAPGFIHTPMTEGLKDAQREVLLSRIPMGCMGTPEQVAAAVVYLASDEAAWVTGSTLHVNGGMAMA